MAESRRFLIFSLSLDPAEAWTWFDLALTERAMGRAQEALAHLEVAGGLSPAVAGPAARTRATMLRENGDRAGAQAALAGALSKNPKDEETRQMLNQLQGNR